MVRQTVGICLILCMVAWLGSLQAQEAGKERVFELRTYVCHEGKLENLHKRFREHTNRLFAKHGITMIGYWTPTDGDAANDTLVYLLAYPSREAATKSWESFKNDPEWKQAYADSHKDGPIVKKVESKFLKSTDYSAIK